MEHSIEGGMMGVDRFSISPVLDRASDLSSIKAWVLMSDLVCLYWAGTRNSDSVQYK